MGLSASMWTSVSGLLAHGDKMNVVGNNLANVSTIGFKAQRMDFEDFVYTNDFAASGTIQVGLGVGVNALITDFSQGAFESTNSATDLAISGSGYFKVVNQSTGSDYYTRAGNFNFDAEGFLTLPSGEVLQGWKVNNNTSPLPASGINPVIQETTELQLIGEATDIKLDSWTVLPKATTKVDFSVNLTSTETNDKSVSVENPLFAMADAWNGREAVENDVPAIAEDAYVYPAPIKVYDESGKEHTLTCYFDRVPTETVNSDGETIDVIDNLPTGYEVYEYMLTMDPNEDARTFGGTYDPTTGVLTGATSFQDTEAAGILMKGTMIFNAAGELVSQSAYTYMGNTDIAPGQTISPDGVDIDIEHYLSIDPAAVAPAETRDSYIDSLGLSPELTAQLKTDLPATVAAADQTAQELATLAADKAAEAAGKAAGTAAVTAESANIQATAEAAATADAQAAGVTAGRDVVRDALIQAGNPAPTDADIDAAIAGGAPYSDLYNDAFVTARDATYAAVLPARYEEAYQAVYDAAYTPAFNATHVTTYNLEYNELSQTLPSDAIAELQNDINSEMIGHPDSALSWQPTEVSAQGYPLFTANFSGHPMGNSVGQEKSSMDLTDSKDADDIWMEFNLGLQSENPMIPWQYQGSGLQRVEYSGTGTIPTTASIMDTYATLDPTGNVAIASNYESLGTLIPNDRSTGASTNLGTSSSTNFSYQDGYPSGDLTNVHFDAEGVLYGIYSNGVSIPLYQLAMYDFVNPQGLYREGGNLYSETLESGSIQQAQAGIAGMGSINAYNIEQSNVDMTREFVQMISTQRGFQANSKGITTVDTMLEQVINMKR